MTHTKKHPYRGRVQTEPVRLDTLRIEEVSAYLDELYTLGQLPIEAESISRPYCERFLSWFIHDVERLRSVVNIREFYDACKDRYRDLSDICKELLTAGPGQIHVSRIDSNGDLRFYLMGSTNRKISLTVAGEECYRTRRKPKVYGQLLRMLTEVTAWLEVSFDQAAVSDQQYTEIVGTVVLIATTLGKVYEDMRGGDAFESDEYARASARMHVEATPLDKESRWMDVFEDVRTDINSSQPPRYVRDLARLRTDDLGPYQYEDYHMSFKKTGASFEGIALPGLYAALVELDHANCDDDLIGYTSHYNQVETAAAKCYPRKSMMVPQHKLDLRFIHLAENAIQDRASYYHNRLAMVVRRLRTDCTFDQNEGKRFAQKVTSPRWIEAHRNNVYCLDISKATDTLNLEFQRLCLSLIWPEEHVKNWSNIMTGWAVLVHRGKEIDKFLQEVGQPQGLKSSFPAFAFVHHIVMRMVMKANHLENTDPQEFYRVLGDDSIISWPDPTCSILNDYKACCSFIGWQTNDKGYTYVHGVDVAAFAEFAKIRYLDGKATTPIPIRLLTGSCSSAAQEFTLLCWYCDYVRPVSLTELMEVLDEHWGLSESQMLAIMALSQVADTEFNRFKAEDELELDPSLIETSYLAYSLGKLKQTLLNQFIPDQLLGLSDEEKERRVEPFLDSRWEKKLLNCCQDMDNKYMLMVEHNQDLINAVGELFGPQSVAVGALHLKEDEARVIIQFCEMVMDLIYTGPLPIDVYKPICDRTCAILRAYNPRSDVLATKQSANFLESFESYFERIVGLVTDSVTVVA